MYFHYGNTDSGGAINVLQAIPIASKRSNTSVKQYSHSKFAKKSEKRL